MVISSFCLVYISLFQFESRTCFGRFVVVTPTLHSQLFRALLLCAQFKRFLLSKNGVCGAFAVCFRCISAVGGATTSTATMTAPTLAICFGFQLGGTVAAWAF